MTDESYELVVARAAARAIADELPEPIATAVIDFITGPLIEQPQRVGRALRNELAGVHSARRGTYRVLHRIDDEARDSSCSESNTAAACIAADETRRREDVPLEVAPVEVVGERPALVGIDPAPERRGTGDSRLLRHHDLVPLGERLVDGEQEARPGGERLLV